MKHISLRQKTVWILGTSLAILVLFSTIISYIFYSGAIRLGTDADKTQFFVIFSCAEFLVAIVLVALGAVYIDLCIVAPLKNMTEAVKSLRYEDTGNEDGRLALKELNIHSGDELEELYEALKQFQRETGEYLTSLKQENWAEEHDHMTMLDNKEKFERRVKEVYPLAHSIFVACLNIINLHVVNEKLGFDAGDSILSKVARELRRLSGDTIHAYRLEDDHFVLIFTDYSEEDAKSVMKNWTERVGRLNRASDKFECRLAWGGCYGSEDFDTMDIFRHADTELYCNKALLKKELEKKL